MIFTHRGGVVGFPVSEILNNPETFIMSDGKSMLNLQMDNDGMVQYCINVRTVLFVFDPEIVANSTTSNQ